MVVLLRSRVWSSHTNIRCTQQKKQAGQEGSWKHCFVIGVCTDDDAYLTKGLLRELNPGPLAPEARIIPLDQAASTILAIVMGPRDTLLHLDQVVAPTQKTRATEQNRQPAVPLRGSGVKYSWQSTDSSRQSAHLPTRNWASGYDVSLTRRRSSVRSLLGVFFKAV